MNSYTVVTREAMVVVGLVCRASNSPTGVQVIQQQWNRFYSENLIEKIPHKSSNEVIALYCDYEGDHTQPYSFVIGCPVRALESIPEGMVAKIIPSSSYAHFSAIGDHPESLIATWETIWQQRELKRSYSYDYEVYGEKFFTVAPREVEVYVAIQPPSRSKRPAATVSSYLVLHQGEKVLLQLRKQTGYCDHCYGLPSGHVEEGEAATTAMIREAYEEVAIRLESTSLQVVHVMHRKSNRVNIDLFFQCCDWQGEVTNREVDKCAGVDFFSLDELPSNTIDYIRVALNHIAAGVLYSESDWDQ